MGNHEEVEKKPIYKKWWFWLIIIVIVIAIASSSSNNTNTTEESSSNVEENSSIQTTSSDEEVSNEESTDVSKIIYDDNDIIIKITGYEYHSVMDYLDIDVYIENNSSQDLTITIDGDVTLDGYTLDTYFYEEVNTESKSNTSFSIYNLADNGLDANNLSSLKFALDIYHSENYIIDDRIEDGITITYDF